MSYYNEPGEYPTLSLREQLEQHELYSKCNVSIAETCHTLQPETPFRPMNTLDIKALLAEHFDRSSNSSNGAQYFQGEHWLPKHTDALHYLIEGVKAHFERDVGANRIVREKLEKLSVTITDAGAEIESANESMWKIINEQL